MKQKTKQVRERWRIFVGSPKYEVSNTGKIRNRKTKHILNCRCDRYGYPRFSYLNNKNKRITKTVHRAVGETWLRKRKNHDQINHVDGVKTNNDVTNLEWVTVKRNIIHSYEMLLNSNTSPVLVSDLLEKKETKYRSIKDLAKFLNNPVSVLVPLIKHSDRNPIEGRYIVTVLDELAMLMRANTKNFGRKVFVYDEMEEKLTTYPSTLLACYFTGIRSISQLSKGIVDVLNIIGYQVTYDEELITKRTVDKQTVFDIREKYLLTPKKSRDICYYVYDYYRKSEYCFDNFSKCVDFLDKSEPIKRRINSSLVSTALGYCTAKLKTGLIKGYGIRSDYHPYDWFLYSEEVILSNRFGFSAPRAIYKIVRDGNEVLAFGKEDLLVRLGYVYDKIYLKYSLEEVVKSANIPNISVTRLNKPIP